MAFTRVVQRIDGETTVADLIAFVAETYRLNRKEAEVSLLNYMDMLGKRNLVGFRIRKTTDDGDAPDAG